MQTDKARHQLVRLSDRLSAIVSMVDGKDRYPGAVLCDVGTDHAHIPIRLLQEGRIDSAIAMDVIPGPIGKAKENLKLYGVEPGLVRLRLSDGLDGYQAGEADTLVIAGMGGRMMSDILVREPEKSRDFKEMILQPQSDPGCVRRALRGLGLVIDREKIVPEDGKYYPVIHAVHAGPEDSRQDYPGEGGTETERQLVEDQFGPVLLREKDEVLRSCLIRQKNVCERILLSMEKSHTKESAEFTARRAAVIRQLHLIKAAMDRMKDDPHTV